MLSSTSPTCAMPTCGVRISAKPTSAWTILRNANLQDAWMWKTDLTRALLGGDDPFEPNQEGKVNVQGYAVGRGCLGQRLREARNYVLAYYGIRNGLEILRYREFSHFEGLERLGNDLAYKSAVDNLRKEPDRENVDSEYLSALEKLLNSSDVTKPEKNAKTAKFLKDIKLFISRNADNRRVLNASLGFRTDEQLLLGQLPNYNFDDMNLREADLRRFQLTTASFSGLFFATQYFMTPICATPTLPTPIFECGLPAGKA